MGAYLLGPFAGATLGCVFGLTSMWKASTSAIEYADIVFSPFLSGKPVESLILSLATRIIFGYVSGAAFSFIKKINCSKINIVITATSVNIFHSLLIYSCLHLFFPESNITIFYGIKRVISLNNITTCLICSYLTILLNEFVKQNKKMNYLNTLIKPNTNKKLVHINIIFMALLFVILIGIWFHFYGRYSYIINSSKLIINHNLHIKFVNLWIQFLITIIAIFTVSAISFITIGNYFLKLSFQATRDMMTLLLNKNTFINHVNNILTKKNISSYLLILDVDNFKKINDTYGHPVGDKILIKIATILQNNFEDYGIIGRLGGDEFAVFIENISEDTMRELSQRTCSSIAQLQISEIQNVSCSIGISKCKYEDTFENIYLKSDKALYIAKQKGKNRYIFAK